MIVVVFVITDISYAYKNYAYKTSINNQMRYPICPFYVCKTTVQIENLDKKGYQQPQTGYTNVEVYSNKHGFPWRTRDQFMIVNAEKCPSAY